MAPAREIAGPLPSHTIREAGSSDAAVLASVVARSFRTVAERFRLTPENCPKHPSNCTPDWIRKHQAREARYFILEVEAGPVGCVALTQATDKPGVFYVERLAVLPPFRGRGYATALMNRVHHVARERGAHRIEIAIIAAQTELAAFYERRGYVATGTRRFDHLPFLVQFMALTIGC